MSYQQLRVRFAANVYWEDVAVDETYIDVVKRTAHQSVCSVYDIDGCLLFEVDMPFDQLVAKLNGEPWPVPKKAEPVVVSKWVWVPADGKCVQACFSQSVAEHTVSRHGGHAVELKGEYTP